MMTTERQIRRLWPTMVLALVAGCMATDAGLGNSPIEDVGNEEHNTEGIEQWGCGDYFDGCQFRCPVTLTANFHTRTGTVKFAGTTELAAFRIQGLERRWDWWLGDDGSYNCAFVLSSDGRGRYYDFTREMPDSDGVTRVKPADLFKCRHQRVRN